MNDSSRPARPVAPPSPFGPPPAVHVAPPTLAAPQLAVSAPQPAISAQQAPALPPRSQVVRSSQLGNSTQHVEVSSNGEALNRQLDAIIRPTTVEDLAKKGGQLKAVKERDLRELIRQSLLQLLASETAMSSAEQERILDRVQGELKKKMTAHAGEQAERLAVAAENQALHGRMQQLEQDHADRAGELGRLRASLATAQREVIELRADLDRQALLAPQPMTAGTNEEPWARAVDEAWFSGRQRREAARGGTPTGELLSTALQGHLATCAELLADYAANPPGGDAAADVLARIRVLLAVHVRDQTWISELQQRATVVAGERDDARAAAEAELQRTIEIEAQLDELTAQLAAYEAGVAERDDLIAGRDAALAEADAALVAAHADLAAHAAHEERTPYLTLPDTSRDGELTELRDRLDDALRRCEDAVRARTRVEQDLAAAAGGRAAAEHHLVGAENRLASAEQRVRDLQQQLGDQRKTTDIARLASVEVEAQRAEVTGLKNLLHEREQTLAGERDRAHADRDRHRADGAVRLEALKRVEQALLVLRDQLAERDAECATLQAQLAEAQAQSQAAAAPPQLSAHHEEANAQHFAPLMTALVERDALRDTSEKAAAALAAGYMSRLHFELEGVERRTAERIAALALTLAQVRSLPAVSNVPAPTIQPPAAPVISERLVPVAPASVVPAAIPRSEKPAKRPALARVAGPACLGDDERARFAYLRGARPRLIVHGATWDHQDLAATSAATGSRPVIVMVDSEPWVVYRDHSGALHWASAGARGMILGEGLVAGEPAILVDPAQNRWLLAARDAQGRAVVHSVIDGEARRLAEFSASGDPAWWPRAKDGAADGVSDQGHRLVMPAGGATVALHHQTANGWSPATTLTFAPAVDEVAAVAVAVGVGKAGRGGEAVLAVRSPTGVVAARRSRRDGTWEEPQVLDASGAPAIGGLAAAQGDGETLVAYRSDDGLLQLMLHRGAWRHLAFGSNFKAPAAASDPQLLLHDGMIRCFYVGVDEHVHEVRNNAAGWHHYDLTVVSRDL